MIISELTLYVISFMIGKGLEPQDMDFHLVRETVRVFCVTQYPYVMGAYINYVGCTFLFYCLKYESGFTKKYGSFVY